MLLSASAWLLLAAVSTVAAVETGSVSGVVYDDWTGNPIGFASVFLVESARGTTAGPDGSFRIDSLLVGTHLLGARHISYSRAELRVEITKGVTSTVEFRLLGETDAFPFTIPTSPTNADSMDLQVILPDTVAVGLRSKGTSCS